MRLAGEQQVAAVLEGVGPLGALVDVDHPAPDRGRAPVEDAAEGEVGGRVLGRVLLGGVVVEVLAAVADVGAGDLGAGAAAGELGLHPDLAVGGAEAERDPLEVAVALDLGALAGEDPGGGGEGLAADVAQVRAGADDQLGDAVEEGVGLGVGREVALPDLGLGALLEHDQRPPVERAAALLAGSRSARSAVSALMLLRHVDQRAAAPAGVVDRDEGIPLAGDDRAEASAEQLRDSARRRRRAARRSGRRGVPLPVISATTSPTIEPSTWVRPSAPVGDRRARRR